MNMANNLQLEMKDSIQNSKNPFKLKLPYIVKTQAHVIVFTYIWLNPVI